jgi:hypothetical protein
MEIACDSALKNRRYDADGRLHILRTPISKATVNPYYGREIPGSEQLGLEPERVYYLLRDPGELAKAAPSFARNQLMFIHTPVSADDPKQDSIAGTIGSDVEFQAPYLIADLCIWDVEAIAGVETDTVRELSASYRYRADMTPGMYEGQMYDGVMRDIQGNHVALVKSGRAGADVMAADNELETKMETKFGKALYAILCAASPKLAQDAALKPLVIGLTRKQCDLRALEPKLLAMDSALRIDSARLAMDAVEEATEERPKAKDRIAKDAQTGEEKAMWAQMRKDGSADDPQDDSMPASLRKAQDKKAKDSKSAKDLSFEEWAKQEESEPDHKAKDGEEESMEEKKRRYEREKRRADDAEEENEEERKERLEKRKAADKKAKDCSAKDSEEEEKKKAEDGMKKAMDEFKADLRSADEARRAVRPVVGDVLAQDSAADIYGFALDQMKVDRAGVEGVPALRALFNLAQQASKPAPRVAFDAVSVEEKFTGAGRQIQVM